jgi:hypothetical protein
MDLARHVAIASVVAGLVLGGGKADADQICVATVVSPAPALAEHVVCDQAAISRYFLLSPNLATLSDAERTAVFAQPLRYAFAYMGADALDRLRAGFADPKTRSVDLTAILTTRDPKGVPVPHQLFELRASRADIADVNLQTLAPQDLFRKVPSALSPYLVAGLKAESGKAAAAP